MNIHTIIGLVTKKKMNVHSAQVCTSLIISEAELFILSDLLNQMFASSDGDKHCFWVPTSVLTFMMLV